MPVEFLRTGWDVVLSLVAGPCGVMVVCLLSSWRFQVLLKVGAKVF